MKTAIKGLSMLVLGACATTGNNPIINHSVREQGRNLIADVCVSSGFMEEDEAMLEAAGRFETYRHSGYSHGKGSQHLYAEGTQTGLTMDKFLSRDDKQFCARYRVSR